MKRIILPVLLSFLGPGLGQFYNREYKKGWILLISALLLFCLPLFWIIKKVAANLPDLSQPPDQQQIEAILSQVMGTEKHLLNILTFLFLGLWAYAITQAYFKAKEISGRENEEEENAE